MAQRWLRRTNSAREARIGLHPDQVRCRGIRGATTTDGTAGDLEVAVAEMLEAMLAPNGVGPEEVAALVFTLQEDLAQSNPAAVARRHGFAIVPLLMVREHGGDTRVPRCLRALMMVNTPRPQALVRHAYLRGAQELRPDLAAAREELL